MKLQAAIDELEALKQADDERKLSAEEYRRWDELTAIVAEGYEQEAKKYDSKD